MKLLDRETDFKARVVEAFDELPPQQQLVANYLLENVREVTFLSVPDLAQRSGASEATIVRFAQRLGYDGFASLKANLAEALRENVLPGLPPAAQALAKDPNADPLSAVASQEMVNIQRTAEEIDRETFARVAKLMFRVDQVYVFGRGISSHLAEMAVYLFTQVGVRATVVSPRFSSPLEALVTMSERDALLALSFPPYSPFAAKVVQTAKQKGAKTIALTDRVTAPVARVADEVLTVRTENMMFTNSFAAVSTVLNALVTAAALKNPERAGAAVAEITEIFESERRS